MKTIVMRVDETGLYYSETGYLPWSSTNLPKDAFQLRRREALYWELAMLEYFRVPGLLKVEVVDFSADPEDFLRDRSMKHPVQCLVFAPLDAEAFKAQLTYYRAGPLAACLTAEDGERVSATEDGQVVEEGKATSRAVKFKVPIMDFTFGNGGVSATVELPGVAAPLTLRIGNDHLVAEFDAIKPFFVKALRRQTATVTAELVFTNDEPHLQHASSPQISRIDEKMLEIFRVRSLRQLTGGDAVRTVDKSLFTPEDIFASLDDDDLGRAVLPRAGQDLLTEILRHKRVRNARQLEFLAGRLHRADYKLRFVLSPHFGFVFVTEGQDGRHFILELLNSHATYVWSIPKNWKTLSAQFAGVAREIAAIGAMGRGQYRRSLHFEHEFWFVIHEAAERGIVDGFPRWKNRLLEGLV